MKTKLLRTVGLSAIGILILSGCSASNNAGGGQHVNDDCVPVAEVDTVEAGKLKVVAFEAAPRWSGDPSDPTGWEPTLMNEFADALCLDLEWTVVPALSAAIESVSTGRADIAGGGIWRSEDRGKVIAQSDPIFRDGPVLISKSGSGSLDDFSSMGTPTGWVWVEDLQTVYGDGLQQFQSTDAVAQAVAAGHVEAGFLGGQDGPYLASMAGGDLIAARVDEDPRVASTTNSGWPNYPTSKDNPALTEALNVEIAKWRENGLIASALEAAAIDPDNADISEWGGE